MSGSDLRVRLAHRISTNQFTALFALVTVGAMSPLIAVALVWGGHRFWTIWNGAAFLIFDLVFGTLGVLAALMAARMRRQR